MPERSRVSVLGRSPAAIASFLADILYLFRKKSNSVTICAFIGILYL
nr:MAG TPA: hypothetical protein [Caudoviricetes sp.]DAO57749.1 MAG TPA: hypothetical protein [Caudoviricetes sp.]